MKWVCHSFNSRSRTDEAGRPRSGAVMTGGPLRRAGWLLGATGLLEWTPAKRQVCCEDLPSPLLHLVLPLPSWRRRGMGSEDLDAPPTCGSAWSRPAGRREMARGARSSAFASISWRWAKYRQGRRTCKSCAVLLSWLTDFNHSFRENKIAFRDLDAVLRRGFQNPLLALS